MTITPRTMEADSAGGMTRTWRSAVWLLIACSVVAGLLLARPGLAEAGSYPLDRAEAAGYMTIGLKRQFGASFTAGYRHKIKCRTRIARDRRGCSIYWLLGDSIYRGWGKIWIAYPRGRVIWNYGYRIKRINTYCRSTGGSNCVTVIADW